jgi:hypothetical protein
MERDDANSSLAVRTLNAPRCDRSCIISGFFVQGYAKPNPPFEESPALRVAAVGIFRADNDALDSLDQLEGNIVAVPDCLRRLPQPRSRMALAAEPFAAVVDHA